MLLVASGGRMHRRDRGEKPAYTDVVMRFHHSQHRLTQGFESQDETHRVASVLFTTVERHTCSSNSEGRK